MTVASNPNQQLQELYDMYAQGGSLPDEIVQLQQAILQIEQQLQSLNELQTTLNGQLDDLEQQEQKNPSEKLEAQIAALKTQIQGNQSQIGQANSSLASNQKSLMLQESSLQAFVANNTTSGAAMKSMGNQFRQMTQTLNQKESQAAASAAAQRLAEQQRQNALNAIQNYSALALQFGSAALTDMDDIKADQAKIATDQAQEEVLKDEIIQDSIKAAACYAAAAVAYALCFGLGAPALIAAGAYYTAMAIKAKEALDSVKADEAAAQSDLVEKQADLKTQLTALAGLDVSELNGMIDQLFTSILKVFALLGTGQGGVQQATVVLAQALSILQMITTKVHEKRAQDQQWMSRGSADGFEGAAKKSQVNLEAMAALQEYAKFMSGLMTVAKVATDVASVALATASGGTLAPVVALMMIALSESKVFEMATTALADAMKDKCGEMLAKVLAEVIVTVACVFVAFSLASAVKAATAGGESAGSEAGAQVKNALGDAAKQVEIEMVDMGRGGAAVAVDVGAESAGARAAGSKISLFLDSLKQMLTSGKQVGGVGGMFFGANNGISDLVLLFYAVHEGKGGESKKDLEKDNGFQIMELIMTVVQAILMMLAAWKGFAGEEGEKSLLAKLTDKFETSLPTIISRGYDVQNIAALLTAAACGGQAGNSSAQANLTESTGSANAAITTYKSLEEIMKQYESKEIESFANAMQQSIEALQITMRKNAQAEMEAAKLLLETAV